VAFAMESRVRVRHSFSLLGAVYFGGGYIIA
jgi:hypothetical protein